MLRMNEVGVGAPGGLILERELVAGKRVGVTVALPRAPPPPILPRGS